MARIFKNQEQNETRLLKMLRVFVGNSAAVNFIDDKVKVHSTGVSTRIEHHGNVYNVAVEQIIGEKEEQESAV